MKTEITPEERSIQSARAALGELNFAQFFKELSVIGSIYEKQKLLEEAVTVATKIKSSQLLIQLSDAITEKEGNNYSVYSLLKTILGHLVEMSDYHSAIGVATLHSENEDTLWQTLCTALLKKEQMRYVDKCYPYLKTVSAQASIAGEMLEKIDLSTNPEQWLKWFYHYLPADKLRYFAFDNYLNRILDFVVSHENINTILPFFKNKESNEPYQKFLIQLFYKLVTVQQFNKAEAVLVIMPKEIEWMKLVYQTLNDENAFHAFSQLQFQENSLLPYGFNDFFLEKALENLLRRHEQKPLEELSRVILNAVKKASNEKDVLIPKLYQLLIIQKHIDVIFQLLNDQVIEKNYTIDLFSKLIEQDLNAEQYQFILKNITSWPETLDLLTVENIFGRRRMSYQEEIRRVDLNQSLKILKKIPIELVKIEHASRYPEESKKRNVEAAPKGHTNKKAKLKLLTKHDLLYDKITDGIHRSINDHQFKQALESVQKLVPSKDRDAFLKTIALGLWDQNEIESAKKACSLMQSVSPIWKEWPTRIQDANYQKTLDWLCTGNFYEVKALIFQYIKMLLKKLTPKTVMETILASPLLEDNKINLNDFYRDNAQEGYFDQEHQTLLNSPAPLPTDINLMVQWEENSHAGFIIHQFVHQFADDVHILKKLEALKIRGISGFETLLLHYYLSHKQLDKAIDLINLFIVSPSEKNWHNDKNYFQKTIINYFRYSVKINLTLPQDFIKIKDENIRKDILSAITHSFSHKVEFWQESKLILLHAILDQVNIFSNYESKISFISYLFDEMYKNPAFFLEHVVEKLQDNEIRILFIKRLIILTLSIPNEPLLSVAISYFKPGDFWHTLVTEFMRTKREEIINTTHLFELVISSLEHWKTSVINQSYFYYRPFISSFTEFLLQNLIEPVQAWSTYQIFYQQRINYVNYTNKDIKDLYEEMEKSALNGLVNLAVVNDILADQLIAHLESVIAQQNETHYFNRYEEPVFVNTIKNLLNKLVVTKNLAMIRKIFKSMMQMQVQVYTQQYMIFPFKQAISAFMEAGQHDVCKELLLIVLPQYYRDFSNEFILLSKSLIDLNHYQQMIDFLNEVEKMLLARNKDNHYYLSGFNHDKSKLIFTQIIHLVNNKKINEAFQTYIPHAPINLEREVAGEIESLLKTLIDNNALIFANTLLQKEINAPEKKLYYKQALVNQHFKRLATWIEKEYADKIKEAYHDLLLFFHNRFNPAYHAKANSIKNQLITTLKNLLDKAFLAYYQKTFQTDPPRHRILCNFPVPVNEQCKGKTTKEKLDHFLSLFDMLKIDLNLYRYLLSIQPAHNPAYQWLSDLRKMRNEETHAEIYLPEKPVVNGQELDMQTYLPDLVSGIEKILIKLFHPDFADQQLNRLSFDALMPINPQTANSVAPFFNLPLPVIALAPVMQVTKSDKKIN